MLREKTALLLTLSGLTFCGPPDHEPMPQTYRYQFWLDVTGSISTRQRVKWLVQARHAFSNIGRFGNRVELYPIHDRTSETAPLAIAEFGNLGPQATLSENLQVHSANQQQRKRILAAFEDLEEVDVEPNSTSILGLVDLYQPDHLGRPTIILIFSDMLETSFPRLDMEKRPLPEDVSEIATQIVRSRRWGEDRMRGVKVFCVVRELEAGQTRPVNSRRVLHEFWSTLFEAVGAEVVNFNTQLDGRLVGARPSRDTANRSTSREVQS